MPSAVINIRPVADNTLPRFIRVTRRNADDAIAAFDERVILYAPRDHELHGYFASATLVDVHLDLIDTAFMFVEIKNVERFRSIVPTTDEGEPFELGARGREGSMKWWAYSAGLRALTDTERDAILAQSGRVFRQGNVSKEPGLTEDEIAVATANTKAEHILSRRRARNASLRMEILTKHGPVCALTGVRHVAWDGRNTEVDVCHIIPLRHNGPDQVSNLIPLGKTIHWGFDAGWVSMLRDGTIILSPHADDDFRSRFGRLKRARFPEEVAYWPAAESIEYHRNVIFQAN